MKRLFALIVVIILSLSLFYGCATPSDGSHSDPPSQSQTSESEGTTGDKIDSGKTDIPSDLPENADTLTVTFSEGTDNCWTVDGKTLTFSGLAADTVCQVSGEFNGRIVIDVGDDYKFELELCGVTLYSEEQSPVVILSGDKVTLTAKKGTANYIYDERAAVSDDDETAYSSAIYSLCDLELGGKGELVVISANNNGIHTKDDLKVKNLTLSVTCEDNALKGNDSVTIYGGIITLIAKSGDGIKTKNTDISSKGNQRGTIAISGGTTNIYAACDGIDAAFNAEISGETILNVYTERYSPYTETTVSVNSEKSTYRANINTGNRPGRPDGPGGAGGGFGGMTDGNTEKGDHSTKGIKADNDIIVSGGTITVNSYDDALHANGGTTLENGNTSTGNVTVSGGTLTLFSKDDAVHADGTLTVSDGTIDITGCYEGLEGTFVVINGGNVSIVSSDDGINATTTSGTGITFNGGKVYVYAGGDGIDSNSRTAYRGILFADGEITVVSTSGGDSAIDTEQGYTYTGGTILALCPSNGMGNESLNCSNFSSIGAKTTMNLSQGQTLTVKVDGVVTAEVTMPCRLSALVIYLGSASAEFSV